MKQFALEAILKLKTDILILAGKPNAIDLHNADDIEASIVVPGGNLSITEEAEAKVI